MSPNIPLRVRNLVRRYATTDPYRIAKDMRCEVMPAPTPSTTSHTPARAMRTRLTSSPPGSWRTDMMRARYMSGGSFLRAGSSELCANKKPPGRRL